MLHVRGLGIAARISAAVRVRIRFVTAGDNVDGVHFIMPGDPAHRVERPTAEVMRAPVEGDDAPEAHYADQRVVVFARPEQDGEFPRRSTIDAECALAGGQRATRADCRLGRFRRPRLLVESVLPVPLPGGVTRALIARWRRFYDQPLVLGRDARALRPPRSPGPGRSPPTA